MATRSTAPLLVALLLGLPLSAGASHPVILVEPQVEQYRVAADAAGRQLEGATRLDPVDPGAAAGLGEASVVVAVGRKALNVARQKAGANTPVVFCMVLGVTPADLGRAVTGVPLEADPASVLERIRAVAPAVKRVGVVYDPNASGLMVEAAKKAAPGKGLTLTARPVAASTEVKAAVEGLVGAVDALWLPADPKLYPRELTTYLLALSSERRLPLFGFLASFTQAGALASVSPDYADNGERAGRMAAAVAAKPEPQRLPVPPPSYAPGDLSVNLKTAAALGLEVPEKALAGAKQVIR